MSEEQAIKALCQKYLDAFLAGKSALMNGVFEPSAAIRGIVAGQPWAGDFTALAAFCDSNPPGKESGMSGEITVLERVNDSACIKIEVRNYMGLSFTDLGVLQKIDGQWMIVGKAFSST